MTPAMVRTPMHFATDAECLKAALRMSGPARHSARIVRVRNTLALDRLVVSPALAAEVPGARRPSADGTGDGLGLRRAGRPRPRRRPARAGLASPRHHSRHVSPAREGACRTFVDRGSRETYPRVFEVGMAQVRAGATIDDLYRAEGKAEIVNGELSTDVPRDLFPAGRGEPSTGASSPMRKKTGSGYAFPDNVGFIVNLPKRRSFSPDAAFHLGPLSGGKFLEGAPGLRGRGPERRGLRAGRGEAHRPEACRLFRRRHAGGLGRRRPARRGGPVVRGGASPTNHASCVAAKPPTRSLRFRAGRCRSTTSSRETPGAESSSSPLRYVGPEGHPLRSFSSGLAFGPLPGVSFPLASLPLPEGAP